MNITQLVLAIFAISMTIFLFIMLVKDINGLFKNKEKTDITVEIISKWIFDKISDTPIKLKLLNGGIMPKYQHDGDAGYDCYARLTEPITIEPGTVRVIPLGFCLELPKNWYADVRPRSGLAAKKHVVAQLGLIDEPYRNELGGIISNFSSESFTVNNGDRVCQIMCHEEDRYKFVITDNLSTTNRGEGFGSSGI